MRILYVCGDGIFAGLEKVTLNLVNTVRSQGHEVLCLGSYWGTGQFTKKIIAEGIPLERSWFGFISLTPRREPVMMTLAQLRKLPTLWRDFRRVVRDWQPDVIHFTNFHHVFLMACGPTRLGVPSLYHVHNIFDPTLATRLGLRVVAGYVDRFVAVSAAVRDNLLRLGVSKGRISVVLNGVQMPELHPGRRQTWRERYGWSDEDVVVGIVGQVGEWKGHDVFIEALSAAQRRYPVVKGLVVGGGEPDYVARLERRAHAVCLPGSVAFAGFHSDMNEVYPQLDVVAVPSLVDESFSLAAAEAASYGLPVIAASRGALPEVLGDELREWLVPSGDVASLADAICRLAANPSLRHDIGGRARRHAERFLSLERCARQMAAEYDAMRGKAHTRTH